MKDVTDFNFQKIALDSPLCVVDFWSPSCGPCRALLRTMEELEKKNPDCVFAKANISDNSNSAMEYMVNALPTLIFFAKGKVVEYLGGWQSEEKIQDVIDEIRE